jgi:hypothetical protein
VIDEKDHARVVLAAPLTVRGESDLIIITARTWMRTITYKTLKTPT